MEGKGEEEQVREDEAAAGRVADDDVGVDEREPEAHLRRSREEVERGDGRQDDRGGGGHGHGHSESHDHGRGDHDGEEEEREEPVDAGQVRKDADDGDVQQQLKDGERPQERSGARGKEIDEVEQARRQQRVMRRQVGPRQRADQEGGENPDHRDREAAEHQPLQPGLELAIPGRREKRGRAGTQLDSFL